MMKQMNQKILVGGRNSRSQNGEPRTKRLSSISGSGIQNSRRGLQSFKLARAESRGVPDNSLRQANVRRHVFADARLSKADARERITPRKRTRVPYQWSATVLFLVCALVHSAHGAAKSASPPTQEQPSCPPNPLSQIPVKNLIEGFPAVCDDLVKKIAGWTGRVNIHFFGQELITLMKGEQKIKSLLPLTKYTITFEVYGADEKDIKISWARHPGILGQCFEKHDKVELWDLHFPIPIPKNQLNCSFKGANIPGGYKVRKFMVTGFEANTLSKMKQFEGRLHNDHLYHKDIKLLKTRLGDSWFYFKEVAEYLRDNPTPRTD